MMDAELYQAAADKWGADAQAGIAVEEMGELIAALSRYARGRVGIEAVAEEVADVMICMEQMAFAFCPQGMVGDFKQQKIERLAQRVASSNGDERWMRIKSS